MQRFAQVEPFFWWYIAAWSTVCAIGLTLYLRAPQSYALSSAAYRRFLSAPWKLASFIVATVVFMAVAPYTGDYTWDWFDALFMSVFCFFGAPWVVGVLWLALRGRSSAREVVVACILWMFSASWSYDIYIVLRDGHYPPTWFANIFASSVLYIAGGLMWNLDWREGRGMTFAFLEPDWPTVPPSSQVRRIFWFALPFMVLVALSIAYFVFPQWFAWARF